ncbi:MAG: hypothetical protein ACU836_05420 [Gammaproteobacteria bacterium]
MTNISPSVFVFCALTCEAKPLIKAWRLQKNLSQDHPFAVYAGKDKAVIISGLGKVNMAAAVAYAMALNRNPKSAVLINLGIAGHHSEALATVCLAHKIIDQESGSCFYPQMPFAVTCETQTVTTVTRPRVDYTEQGLYEMEAAGFYEVAMKFSSSELIQVVKIVSDNPYSPITDITEYAVERWVGQELPIIENIIEQLVQLRRQPESALDALHRDLLKEFHFTVSRSLKLKALLRRWRLLKGSELLAWRDAELKDAKALLLWMERQLNQVEFYL